MDSTRDSRATVELNLYELSCEGITVSYSRSGLEGIPQLSYATGDRSYVFRGEEIRAISTEIGRQLSVTLEASPDLEAITFTLILPPLNLEGDEAPIETVALITRHRTSIGGPRLVKGQVLSYETLKLTGVARAVIF
ncbi:hypothetical protein [Chondromyces apiculatus]|uniref:Uncharacterized protein n=1 Tax=Chondromyces apiculatus DSM 436 TaxID=1192034 RepID=A0A017SX60_9BACT|nr:hypothetical protein [Chondromyces apiculatus]EYF00916.1 Hypothetical protein CAP_8864 [Chondromyces apiculatus DSM 436]